MDNLEDAVALFSPRGEADLLQRGDERAARCARLDALPARHPVRQIVERTLAGRKSQGPVSIVPPELRRREAPTTPTGDLLVIAMRSTDANGRFLGAMLVARNLGYLSQVHSTLNYSRKLAALGRLMAGVAHEVKNPLNAMTIHLELLKQKLARQLVAPQRRCGRIAGSDRRRLVGSGPRRRRKHVDIIGKEIRRLDEVAERIPEVRAARRAEAAAGASRRRSSPTCRRRVAPEAERRHITMKIDCPADLPADQRRSRDAAAGAAESGAERVPGDARRRHAEDRLPRRRPTARSRSTSRTPASAFRPRISDDFRPLFHDQGKGQRHRPLDGLSHRPAPRRGSRSPVDAGARNTLPADLPAGLTAHGSADSDEAF